MPQVSEKSYEREEEEEEEEEEKATTASKETMSDDSKCRSASPRIKLDAAVQRNVRLETRYSTSSNATDDNDDDDGSEPWSISNDEIRKVSTSWNESSTSTSSSSSPSLDKYNEIIDQMVGLKFSEKNAGDDGDENEKARVEKSAGTGKEKEAAGDQDDDDDDDDDDESLVERGPVRPHTMTQSHHEKPYYTLNWLASSGQNIDNNQLYMSDYECLSEIVQNKQLYEKLDPYIDKLSKEAQFEHNNYFINNDRQEDSNGNDFNDAIGGFQNVLEFNNDGVAAAAGTLNGYLSSGGNDANNGSMPVTTSDVGDSILEQLTKGAYQEAGSMYDAAMAGAHHHHHWPDNENVPSLSPGSHSQGSSRAQSPGSSVNVGSDIGRLQRHYGPMEGICPQPGGMNEEAAAAAAAATMSFRVRQALSSSESSNHSFGDTASPLSYESAIDQAAEQRLGFEFDSFSTDYPNYMSSDTLVNTAEIIDAIIDNEIQRVVAEEAGTRDELSEDEELAADGPRRTPGKDLPAPSLAVVASETPDRSSSGGRRRRRGGRRMTEARLNLAHLGDALPATIVATTTTCSNIYDGDAPTYAECMRMNNFPSNDSFNNSAESLIDFNNTFENLLASHYTDSSTTTTTTTTTAAAAVTAINDSPPTIDSSINLGKHQTTIEYLMNGRRSKNDAATTKISQSSFNEFQIPETVSAFRQNHLRRYSERQQQQQQQVVAAAGAPWPCLNLPDTAASERLKAQLDPREVEKAMKDLLKRPTEELIAADQDGDTMLMCLVGNGRELEKKKAYLVPLVERIGKIEGSLTMTNDRDQDALYIAAVYCPEMAYVTGYLAAVMLQKNIDIGRRLYRGDNLIHVLAAKGDSHAPVLAQLLTLKTIPEGNSVFDLCQRNYTGRTALEIAVECHDPSGPSRLSCLGVTQLLLQHGADEKMRDTTPYGNTALHTAVSHCRDPLLVKTLLLNCKDAHQVVNMPNGMNDTPVHLAFGLSADALPITAQIQICMDLIEAGGRTDLLNGQGKSPFALVSPDRRETMRNVFFKKKQDPDRRHDDFLRG